MSLNKTKLIVDLQGWMDSGAANSFPIPTLGISSLVSIINSYSMNGEDTFGNKIIGYSGSALTSALSLLVVPGTAAIAALQFSSGISSDWAICTLGTTFGPPSMNAGVSNEISLPPPQPQGEKDFLDVFSTNYSTSLLAATFLADAIHSMATSAKFTLTYQVAGTPPPTLTVSGNIL